MVQLPPFKTEEDHLQKDPQRKSKQFLQPEDLPKDLQRPYTFKGALMIPN